MFDKYSGTINALKQLGVLVGLLIFLVVAGYVLTGSPGAGIAAIVAVVVFFIAVYTFYNLTNN